MAAGDGEAAGGDADPAGREDARGGRCAGRLLDGKLGFREILVVKRKPLNISHVYVYHVEGFRPGGGLYVVHARRGRRRRSASSMRARGMITTADLSYDGKEVVFALRGAGMWRRTRWPISRTSRATRMRRQLPPLQDQHRRHGLTQLTHGAYNNLDPCWLPDGGIAFISDRKPAYAYCYVVTSPVLYRMEATVRIRSGCRPTT
jgi:hypothetical protein